MKVKRKPMNIKNAGENNLSSAISQKERKIIRNSLVLLVADIINIISRNSLGYQTPLKVTMSYIS